MRISDWSSDVCSSDLDGKVLARLPKMELCLQVTPTDHAEPTVAEESAPTFALAEMIAGVAQILPDTAGLWLPQELGYDALGAVSYNKGCYLGQEIVARLHFKGEVKQRLYRLALTAAGAQELPAPASALQNTDGKSLGQLVQAVEAAVTSSGARHLACLAVLRESLAG